jgi:putative heme transporter
VTAILCFLAFMAAANAVSGGVRFLYAGQQQLNTARLLINLGLAVVLSLWALARVRKQRDQEAAVGPVAPYEFEAECRAGASARGASWLRWARWVVTVGVVALAVLMIASQWGTLRSGLDQLGDPHWRELRWAIYAETLALISFAQLTRLLLAAGGARLRFRSMLGLTIASNALALTLPAGPAWAASFSFDQLRRRGVRASLSAYALAVTWVLSAIALMLIVVVGIYLAGSVGPAAPFRVLATVATVFLGSFAVGCVLVLRLPRCRARLGREVDRLSRSPRWTRVVDRLHRWIGEPASARLPPVMLLKCLTAAILNWMSDCGCLVFSILAVGGHVPWQGVLAAYGVTQLAAALPITPGGIGVVEGVLSVLLIAYHMPAATAVAAVILYRIISFWILVPAGWAAVGALVAVQRRGHARAARSARAVSVSGAPVTTA